MGALPKPRSRGFLKILSRSNEQVAPALVHDPSLGSPTAPTARSETRRYRGCAKRCWPSSVGCAPSRSGWCRTRPSPTTSCKRRPWSPSNDRRDDSAARACGLGSHGSPTLWFAIARVPSMGDESVSSVRTRSRPNRHRSRCSNVHRPSANSWTRCWSWVSRGPRRFCRAIWTS